MLTFKYGILIETHQNRETGVKEWRIALFSGSVDEHECIFIAESCFDYSPSLGDSVKVGFDTPTSPEPSIGKKSTDWMRDVQVINETVVIFAIVHFSPDNMQRTFQQHEDSNLRYYIFENADTDCRRVAVPQKLVDREIKSRSSRQKSGEPMVYRIGICYEPMSIMGGVRVRWRYYEDFPMVPVFELYSRDTMLPFLAESMCYGALEAVVIAQNAEGALFWSPRMGCAAYSSVTSSDIPELGSVRLILVKRCLPDVSFGFPVFYEVLPLVLDSVWQRVRVMTDKREQCVYIETSAECVNRIESDGELCMEISHIGRVSKGLEPFARKLIVGEQYFFRLEFQLIENTYQPVIVDLQLKDDFSVQCRVVYVSKKLKKYFAVLCDDYDDAAIHAMHIDFVSIPFRTIFCSHQLRVESDQMLDQRLTVRVRRNIEEHDVVEGVHVANVTLDTRHPYFKVIQGRVWFRTMGMYNNTANELIEFTSQHFNQILTDFSRITEGLLTRSRILALQAQFALTPLNSPMFLIRHVALRMDDLPFLSPNVIADLPPLRTVFHRLFLQMEQERLFQQRELDMTVSNSTMLDTTYSSLRTVEDTHASVPTILDESEFARRSEEDPDETLVETIASSHIFEGNNDHPFPDHVSYASSENGSIMQESWLSSGASSSSSYASSVVERQSLFGYNESSPRRLAGFGSPTVIPTHREPSFKRKKGRVVKFGTRKFPSGRFTSLEVFDILVHRHMQFREMFVDNVSEALHSWTRRPNGKVASTKMRSCACYPIEMTDYTEAHRKGRFPFTHLVRFYCTSDIHIADMSVVVPFGGRFPSFFKGFELGDRYFCHLYSFLHDRMVRFSGHAGHIGDFGVQRHPDGDKRLEGHTVDDDRGHFWLRFRARAARYRRQMLANDTFELWCGYQTHGLIVVEKTPEMMKNLAPFESDIVLDEYELTIEPLAGGPIDISILMDDEDEQSEWNEDGLVFWRAVVEFSERVSPPELLMRHVPFVLKEIETPPGWVPPPHTPVGDSGFYKTVNHSLVFAQQRVDRLRSLNDPRVYWCDGPKIRKEFVPRQVDISTRREKMLSTLDVLYKEMATLKEKGFFREIDEEEFVGLIDSCIKWDDDNHEFQLRKRNHALKRACNFMSDLLCHERTYERMMRSDDETLSILKLMADCLGMNSPHVHKTDEAQRMLRFMYKNKLHDYI